MKKILILSLIFLCLACSNNENSTMFICKGIPDINQDFAYMHFETEKEGYLFGTLTHYKEVNDKEYDNPNFTPQSKDEANIYKTIDGGHSWLKIDSIFNSSFYNQATFNNNSIYIQKINRDKILESHILKFDISKEKCEILKFNFERFGQIWNENEIIYVEYENNGINSQLNLDNKLNIKSFLPFQYTLKTKVLYLKGETYGIDWKNGFTNLTNNKAISLPLNSDLLILQDNNHILIAGNSKSDDNEIALVSYDVNTNNSETIKKFKGYSIIKDLQSNKKVIAGFIGNIKGVFTEYDLLYSLDRGKTWQIQKLEEPNYLSPSCLIGNKMYIYSGGARMQKITFK